MTMLDEAPNGHAVDLHDVGEVAEKPEGAKSRRPDPDAILAEDRERLAEAERRFAQTKAAIERTEEKLRDLRFDAKVWENTVESRKRGVETMSRLMAKER